MRGSINLRNDGAGASLKTHIYRVSNGQWNEVEDMPTGRLNNYCGQVNTAQGKKEIVVAGGNDGSSVIDTVEIFSVEDETWRTGWQCFVIIQERFVQCLSDNIINMYDN